MHGIFAACLLATSALASAVPASVVNDGPKVRSFTFEKVKNNARNTPRLSRRAQTVSQRLENADFLYYANVSLGTPGQPLRLHLDTGSSDIWVESADSELCRMPTQPCAATGTFSRDESSTYSRVSSDFDISYVDGEYARGDYGKDVFRFGDGTEVKDLQFGIGLESTSSEGIMGIGMAENEVQVQRLGKKPYKTLVELMVEQGIIKSKAYSLYLNDLEATTGEVLFGGIDTEKYQGELTTLPIDRRAGQLNAKEFIITCTGVSLTNEESKDLKLTDDAFAIPVLLDTGSTYTYVPTAVAGVLAQQVGAQVSGGSTVPIVPCDIRNYKGSVNFEFSGAKIKIGLNQLAIDAFTNDGQPATFSDGSPLCYFGIMDSGDSTYVMGDTFLRSAYVVYDLQNEQISLAQAAYGTGSNIVEIGQETRGGLAQSPTTSKETSTGNRAAKIGSIGHYVVGFGVWLGYTALRAAL